MTKVFETLKGEEMQASRGVACPGGRADGVAIAGNDLGQRTLAGGAWLLASQLTLKGINLVQVTILARFLDAKAFGLMDIGNLFIFFVGVFTFTGFQFAIIQKPNLESDDVHTAWWVLLGRSIVIAMTLAFLAKPIANLYRSPELVPILLALAFMQPILGLVSASPILFQRNMEYHKIFKLDVGSGAVGLIVGIIAALILRNVWALILAFLATSVSYLLLSYMLHPYRPRWRFDGARFRAFSHYGGWILGSSIFSFALCQGPGAFGSVMFGVAALGLYQMAARFAQFPYNYLSEVIRSALMPAYSQIQGDKDRLSKAFLRTIGLAFTLITGITTLVVLGLPRLLTLSLGARWIESVSLVPVLAVAGGGQALLRTGYPLYLATGRPSFQFALDLVQTVIMIGLLFPLAKLFALAGLPFAMIGGMVCSLPIWWLGIRKCTTCTFKDVFIQFVPAAIGMGAIMVVFFIGQVVTISHAASVISIIWHLGLIGASAFAFFKTIDIAQHFVPEYSALTDLKSIFRKRGQRSYRQLRKTADN